MEYPAAFYHVTSRGFVRTLIGKEYRGLLTDISLSAILGLPDFVDQIKVRFLSKEKHDAIMPLLKESE